MSIVPGMAAVAVPDMSHGYVALKLIFNPFRY